MNLFGIDIESGLAVEVAVMDLTLYDFNLFSFSGISFFTTSVQLESILVWLVSSVGPLTKFSTG